MSKRPPTQDQRPRVQRPIAIYPGHDGRWHGRVTMGVTNDGSPDRRHVTGKTEAAVTEKVKVFTSALSKRSWATLTSD